MTESFSLNFPSKTFLSGEYLALLDGPAILLNTLPRFENQFLLDAEKEYYSNPIEDEENPLHKYWNDNEDFLLDFEYDFLDPYQGAGGFGASSAQWAAFYAFVNQYHQSLGYFFDKTRNENDFVKNLDFKFIEQFLNTYRSYSKAKFPPSGYDVISQWVGKVTYIDIQNKIIKRFDWPFNDISFVLIKSPEKVATHKHLEDLSQVPEAQLRDCVGKVLKGFETKSEKLLIDGIQQNYEILKSAGLMAPQSVKAVDELIKNEYVLAAKGCGALGADVYCVLVRTKNLTPFANFCTSQNLNLIASEADLSYGLEVRSTLGAGNSVIH